MDRERKKRDRERKKKEKEEGIECRESTSIVSILTLGARTKGVSAKILPCVLVRPVRPVRWTLQALIT